MLFQLIQWYSPASQKCQWVLIAPLIAERPSIRSAVLKSCEEKEGARNLPFLRNILHDADEWEGRNNWEMGKRSSSRLWLITIIFLHCRCFLVLPGFGSWSSPHPWFCDHGTAYSGVPALPVPIVPHGFYYVEMQLCSIPAWPGIQYWLPDCGREHSWPEIFP